MLGGVVALAAGPLEAQTEDVLTHEPAPGFEDLLTPRELTFDLFLDDAQIGTARVFVSPGKLRFAEPERILALLPPLRRRPTVEQALTGPLQTHAGLSCWPRARENCGRLEPETVGVILSREANRLDLFLSPAVRGSPRRHLPDPQPGPIGLAGALNLQYALAERGLSLTLQQRAIAGLGRTHFVLESTLSDRASVLERAYLRRIGNGRSLSAGLFPAAPFSFIYLDRLLGLSFATTDLTRIDRNSLSDTPLIVDAPFSGRVEILRDGVLIDTQPYSPGRVNIDTSRFPAGAYPVTLRLIDPSGERTESRFFTRAANLPPPGESRFFVEAGFNVPIRSLSDDFLPTPRSLALRGGADYRIGPQTGASGRVELSAERRLAEVGLTHLEEAWRASATLGATDSGALAGAVTIAGQMDRIRWSLDARAVENSQDSPLPFERGLGRDFRQVSAVVGWSGSRLRLHSVLLWRDDRVSRPSWSLLPMLSWSIGEQGRRQWQIEGSGSVGQSGWTARIGIRTSFTRRGSTLRLYGGGEARERNGRQGFAPIGAVDWSKSTSIGLDPLSLRAGIAREFDRHFGEVGGQLTTPFFQANADAIVEENLSRSALFGRLETVFGFADGRLAFGSGGFTGAGIIAEAPGAGVDSRSAVRTGQSSARPFSGPGPVFVSTRPFTQTHIGINAVGGGSLADRRSEPAVFYPGTVRRLVRRSVRTTVIFATLVDPSGNPLVGASIDTPDGRSETDDQGRLQLEITGASLDVVTQTGSPCLVDLRAVDFSLPFSDVGTVACVPVDSNEDRAGQ